MRGQWGHPIKRCLGALGSHWGFRRGDRAHACMLGGSAPPLAWAQPLACTEAQLTGRRTSPIVLQGGLDRWRHYTRAAERRTACAAGAADASIAVSPTPAAAVPAWCLAGLRAAAGCRHAAYDSATYQSLPPSPATCCFARLPCPPTAPPLHGRRRAKRSCRLRARSCATSTVAPRGARCLTTC